VYYQLVVRPLSFIEDEDEKEEGEYEES